MKLSEDDHERILNAGFRSWGDDLYEIPGGVTLLPGREAILFAHLIERATLAERERCSRIAEERLKRWEFPWEAEYVAGEIRKEP